MVRMPRPLEVLLSVAATVIGVAFFASVPYWPRSWTERAHAVPAPVVVGRSVVAAAPAAPRLTLALPNDLATIVLRRGADGETGLVPVAGALRTYRLRATGDLVSVGAPTGADPVRRASSDADPALRVRGEHAVTVTERGTTTVRWSEQGVTYEISSRTLDARHLAEVAALLR